MQKASQHLATYRETEIAYTRDDDYSAVQVKLSQTLYGPGGQTWNTYDYIHCSRPLLHEHHAELQLNVCGVHPTQPKTATAQRAETLSTITLELVKTKEAQTAAAVTSVRVAPRGALTVHTFTIRL
jgi:hypothetical protein